MVIRHNMLAWNASRQFKINTGSIADKMEKLSSGYRINRGADDAAGLSISEKMRRQIRGLTQASINAQDGISMVQTADGTLEEIQEMLHRGNELSVKAANGTLTDDDRDMVDDEIQQIKLEIDKISGRSVFNEVELFPTYGKTPGAEAGNQVYHYELKYSAKDGTFLVGSENADVAGISRSAGAVSSGNALADKIANELLPNAISQIFDAFPSLKTATNGEVVEMALDISFLDGPGNTLAYAQCSFYQSGRPVSMLLKVDSTDFDDEDAAGTGENAEALESTIAHELMHSVMQYNMTDGMTGRAGSDEFPTWFKEGTAQLAGGGFPTNWNAYLEHYANQLSSETDTTQDANIENYLKSYTVAGRPYGHGYLASAYLGYLANQRAGGGNAVTADNIAAGMDKIFSDIIGGKSLSQAISDNTGLNMSGIESLFSSGDSDLVEFVRKLSFASKGGAGSVIAGSLGDGSTNILGNSASVQLFRIDPSQVNADASTVPEGASVIRLQVGAEPSCSIFVERYRMDTKALGLGMTDVKTQESAGLAIDAFKGAIQCVSNVRSYYGAIQNRLEHTINNLENVIENTTAAESAIRDTDMAKMMVEYSGQRILLQAGQAMIAQANQQPAGILTLLRG